MINGRCIDFVSVLKFEGLMFMKFGVYRGFLIVIGLILSNNEGGCINSVLARDGFFLHLPWVTLGSPRATDI